VDDVQRAVECLQAGGLVVLPTETVYGLAADAADPRAVARIYAVKGRPANHPLILHIADASELAEWAAEIPGFAARLTQGCWPGPLTVVLRRSKRVGDFITGGQDTVAIRVPDHPLALEILRGFGRAVAAPSANVFGHVSPTSAAHAAEDLADRLDPRKDVIVDGGPCRVGVESTIVDCTGERPVILRPGWIGTAEIVAACGLEPGARDKTAPRVSGSLASHYAPRATVRLARPGELVAGCASDRRAELTASNPPMGSIERSESASRSQPGDTPGVGLLALAGIPTPSGMVRLAAPLDADEYARLLYAALREADDLMLAEVIVVPPQGDQGTAMAVRDRLLRAAADRH
jgi:L-threonylcarbamoyladenylate synthase